MENLKKLLNLEEKNSSKKSLILYILLAYIFSILIRLILFYQASENPNYFYNGNIIPLWTADAGLYGYYANQLLAGASFPFVAEYMPGYLLYGIVSLTGMELDKVLFFAPAFFASLVVIPIILIANIYRVARLGLYGAIIGALMTSYYYRTHLGYYDTDILNAFFPLMAIYFLIEFTLSKKIKDAFFASFMLIAFSLWYHSSLTIILAIVAIYALYTLLYDRKDSRSYEAFFLISVALLPLAFIFKVAILIILTILFLTSHKFIKLNYKHYLSLILVALIATTLLVDIGKYYERANNYFDKSSSIELETKDGTLQFKSTLSSVKEAKGITWQTMAKRVSGAIPFFFLALFGYIALLIRYRSMLLTLPMVLLAFLSMVAGLRFTLYGVSILSFAMVFGTHLIFKLILIEGGGFSKKIPPIVSNIFISLIMLFTINSVYDYNRYNISPTLFRTTDDIKNLNELKSTLKKDDFIMTWWDYGWLLWYYTDTKNTLIDNGKHQQDNYIVSKILLSDNQTFTKNASIFFTEKYVEGLSKGIPKVMDYFMQNYPLSYLDKLKDETIKSPQSNRDIYIVLHNYMFTSLGTIESFSNLNLKTGKNYNSKFINMGYLTKRYNSTQREISTPTFSINLPKGELSSKEGKMKVKKISIIENHKIKFERNYTVSNGSNIVIYNGKVLLLKPKLYNSFLIQALVFDNYNHEYFEKVSQTDNFLILKIIKSR